ncbi:MAG: hypothetical protein JWM99_3391 [Verrucomicrobiales bacterium]|nr:hypothetical protein [Verrucomicrobiales bacterium]
MKVRTALLLVAIVGIGVGGFVLFSRQSAKPLIPSPNGYDNYLTAAKNLIAANADSSATNFDALRRNIAENQDALRQVRKGLEFRCEIPVVAFGNGLPSELSSFKGLSQILRTEGDLALSEGRTRDAAKSYLDGIRFGQEVSRGVLIYNLVGIAIEYNAITYLAKCKAKLSQADRQFVLDHLSILATNREPFSTVSERERIFMRVSQKSLLQTVAWPYLWYKMRPALQKAEDKGLQNSARIELLRADLALERFKETNHRWPTTLAELKLVPPPIDPFGPDNALLSYFLKGTEYELYSIGPDRKDDGGNATKDITIESKFLSR